MWARAFGPGSSVTMWGTDRPCASRDIACATCHLDASRRDSTHKDYAGWILSASLAEGLETETAPLRAFHGSVATPRRSCCGRLVRSVDRPLRGEPGRHRISDRIQHGED